MAARLAVMLVALCVPVTAALAQSHSGEHGKRPQEQPAQTQQTTPDDKRGTEQSPLIVKMVPAQKDQNDTKREDQERSQKEELDRQLVDFNGQLAKYTLWLVIVAILQFAVLGIQALVLGWTLRATNRALRITERAFVFLNEFNPGWALNIGNWHLQNFIIRPQWRNSGTTPTRNGKIKVGWEYFDNLTIPADFQYPYEGPSSPMFLGPQGTEWSAPVKIDDHVATKAAAATTHIFIYGRIDYEDVFRAPHFSEWCYRLIIERMGSDIHTQFVAFGPHNRTDEDSA
jgi:hypothetical protein